MKRTIAIAEQNVNERADRVGADDAEQPRDEQEDAAELYTACSLPPASCTARSGTSSAFESGDDDARI